MSLGTYQVTELVHSTPALASGCGLASVPLRLESDNEAKDSQDTRLYVVFLYDPRAQLRKKRTPTKTFPQAKSPQLKTLFREEPTPGQSGGLSESIPVLIECSKMTFTMLNERLQN